MTRFDHLPNDIIREIAISFSLKDIVNLCATNRRLNEIIWRDENFWHLKFLRDYHFTPQDYQGNWRQFYLTFNNNVWVCGDNSCGQLGLDDTQDRDDPTQIDKFKAKQIAAGDSHIIFIDLKNNLWACGDNDFGQLGLGDRLRRTVLTPIHGFKALKIATGLSHTAVIDLENNVWVCGLNQVGQLGLGHYINQHNLIQIPNFKAQQVSAGNCYTIMIDMENNVWGCGYNFFGQLGIGNNENQNVLTQIPNINLLGNLLGKAKQVAAGSNHTIILDLDNNVWICGSNSAGQLGLRLRMGQHINIPIKIDNFKAKEVLAGAMHSLFLDFDNHLWVCGWNRQGQLGLGDECEYVYTPTKIPNFKAQQVSTAQYHTIFIDFDYNVWIFGIHYREIRDFDPKILTSPTQIPNLKAKKVFSGEANIFLMGAYFN